MKGFLDYASKQYYEGNPIITDDEFDKLADAFNYTSVGAPVGDGIAHAFRMYSLQKCYDDEPLIELPGRVIKSPKLDGAAISILYINGELKLSLTRGDGIKGENITDKIRTLVPSCIEDDTGVTQITGEIVASKNLVNSRNQASGALGLKYVEDFCERAKELDLAFVAYGCSKERWYTFYEDVLETLSEWGFTTVLSEGLEDKYPTDGTVYRIDDIEKFEELGYTSKHPRGAFALKERKDGVITTLLDVEWKVGRSGVVSPVAILKPVAVDGAMVSRATLHNIKYIEDLELEYGCDVELIRAGEIIPRVVRRVE